MTAATLWARDVPPPRPNRGRDHAPGALILGSSDDVANAPRTATKATEPKTARRVCERSRNARAPNTMAMVPATRGTSIILAEQKSFGNKCLRPRPDGGNMTDATPPDVPHVECGVFIRTIQGGVIKSLFDSLKDLVHDVVLRVDASGIRMLTMDASKCALVHLKLEAESFENFVCEPRDARYDLGINVSNVFKLIKSTGTKDVISLAYDATGNAHVLELSVQNAERQSNTTYHLKLLDLNTDVRELNDVKVDSVISVPGCYFQQLMKSMSELADSVTISVHGGMVTLSCDGDFASQCTTLGTADGVKSTSTADCTGRYFLKYLVSFSKAANLHRQSPVQILLRNDFLILVFHVGSLGSLRFCLSGMDSVE